MQRIIGGIVGLISCQALAFRTAAFDPSIQDRAVVWQNQQRVENRPGMIWVHAGDSLASGWATRSSLRERLAEAETQEIAAAGSLDDLPNHIPSTKYTWYAGTEIGLGFLGVLDKLFPPEATLVSTALAGATLTPKGREDALGLLLQINETQRVNVVTLSLGSNDACQNLDPNADGKLHDRLRLVKAHMPSRTRWLVWDVVDVATVYAAVRDRLNALPDSPGKRRMVAYCSDSWTKLNCPIARDNPARASEIREQIRTAYREAFGEIVDFSAIFAGRDLLDVMAADCFHPSRSSQPIIVQALENALTAKPLPGLSGR